MKKILLALPLLLVSCSPPDPEPLFEVTFKETNALGVELPWSDPEVLVYKARSRPVRTQVLGGSRYTFSDENGNLIEVKGSYTFQVVQIDTIIHTDPRHSEYKE